MNFLSIDTILGRYEHFGVDLGLDRIQQLLADLGNPHDRVPIVHVAGSNGKGSVCASLSSILMQAGYRVGRYISPHLSSWCERICLNDCPISPDQLVQLLQEVEAAINPDRPSPTQFEVITAAAWLYFAQQQVDIAVIEVGLGGRLDATNVCDRPLVSVITSISLEHWQRLGPTLGAIAGEKAGILKPGCPAVVGPLPPEADQVVRQRATDVGCSVLWPEPAVLTGEVQEWQGQKLPIACAGGIRYPLALKGAFQLANSALVIATVQLLRQQGWVISDQAIATGMAATRWPGRIQFTTWKGQPLLIDGAHNPAAAQVLRQFIDSPDWREAVGAQAPVRWVIGMLSTKDHADVFQALLRSGDALYLVPVPGHSSADPAKLALLARQVCPELSHCQVYEDGMTGLEAALADQAQYQEGRSVVLCGSLYLIGDLLGQPGMGQP